MLDQRTRRPQSGQPPRPRSRGEDILDESGQPSGPDATTQQPITAPQQAPTFAEMQRMGRARPAPPQMSYGPQRPLPPPQPVGTPTPAPAPPVPMMPGGGMGGGAPQLGSSLQQAIMASLGRPSAYGSDEVMRSFDRMSGRIDDDYAQARTRTDEEMARRGIYDSTIAGGRLHDLNIGQRSARTELSDSLLDRQAQTYGSDFDRAIARAMGYGQQGFENQVTTAQMNQGQDQQMLQLLLAIMGLA